MRQLEKSESRLRELVIGVIEDVLTKPPGCRLVKSCDLIFTNKRLICVKIGESSLVKTLYGLTSGASGAYVFFRLSASEQEEFRKKIYGLELDRILKLDESNYAILYEDIRGGVFKTGFLSTLGFMAPLVIYTWDGRKFTYSIYLAFKEKAKTLIKSLLPQIQIK